jgi:hypothetical protein
MVQMRLCEFSVDFNRKNRLRAVANAEGLAGRPIDPAYAAPSDSCQRERKLRLYWTKFAPITWTLSTRREASGEMVGNVRIITDKVVSKYTSAYMRALAWGERHWSGFVRSQKRSILIENATPQLRMFHLLRYEDPSGVSGIGRVAVGVVFPSGKVVLEWLGSHNTLGIYDDLRRVEHIHGHGGKTRIVFTKGAIPYRAISVRAKASPEAHYAADA